MAKRIVDLNKIDKVNSTDFFIVSRPGDNDYKATKSQLQSVLSAQGSSLSISPAVRGSASLVGAPASGNTNQRTLTGNVTPTGEFHRIALGIQMNGGGTWDQGSPTRNALQFGDIVVMGNGNLLCAYVRAQQESSYSGTTTGVYKISTDGGNTWGPENVIISAANVSVTATVGISGVWTNSTGRTFIGVFYETAVSALWVQQLMYSDDFGVTWQGPVSMSDGSYNLFYLTQNKGIEINDGLGPFGSGTLLMAGYGQNLATNATDVTIIKSTDGGKTWSHQGLVQGGITNGLGTTPRYAEPAIAYLGGNNIMAMLRRTDNTMISSCFSTDKGQTWGVITDQFPGQGKPATIVLKDGTIVTLSRSTASDGANFLRTSRTSGATWEAELPFDPRTTVQSKALFNSPQRMYSYYSGLAEYAPNVIAISYGASLAPSATFIDQILTYALNGNARSPLGKVLARGVLSSGPAAFNKQLMVDPSAIQYAVSGTTVTTINSLIDAFVSSGITLRHPFDLPGCFYVGEPRQLPNTVNDASTAFVHADSSTVVANMTVTNGDTLSPNYLVGVWGTSSNMALPESGGTKCILCYDSGAGDLIIEGAGVQGGTVQMAFRIVDGSNFYWCYYDGTKIVLWKVVAGVATQINPNTWTLSAPSPGNIVGYRISLFGTSITVEIDTNVSGTPNYAHKFSMTDSTYGNANTKHGFVGNSSSPTSYTSLKFEYGISALDKIGQLPDLYTLAGGTGGAGDLLQGTSAQRWLYCQNPLYFNGYGYLVNLNTGSKCNLVSGAISKPGPNTYVYVGATMNTSAASGRGLFSTGGDSISYTGTAGNGVGDALVGSNNATSIIAPAFSTFQTPVYPQGPFVLVLVSNGANSALYRDGKLLVSGTMGTVTPTFLKLGDSSNNVYASVAHFSAYNSAFTLAQVREITRYCSMIFDIGAYNPYS